MASVPELKPVNDLYYKLLMSMVEGFVLLEIMYDKKGGPDDFRFLEANPAFEAITELLFEKLIGKTVREVFPETMPFLIEHFKLAAQSGTARVFEHHKPDSGKQFQISAYCPIPGLLACVVTDISDRFRMEEVLKKQEKQYRELAETANTVILRWKPTGIITYINEFGENLFGFSRNELIGRNVIGSIVERTDSAGRDLETMISEICVNPDGFKNNENENMTRDGRILWIQWDNSAILDSNNAIKEIVSIGHDSTGRKLIEDALKESEATFRAHVENSFDVIFTLDAAGTFVFVSPAWERHFGYPPSEVMGKSFGPTVHPDDIQPCVEYLTRILSSGQSGTSPVYRVKCSDGSLRSFVANGMPYTDTKGRLLFIGVGHDVTSQLQAEQERLDFERQLLHTQKLESLGVLAGGIAHDFNNLLQAIHGNLELAALKLPPNSAPLQYIGHAMRAANHAAELTSRMLAYSGKGHFVIKQLDLSELVNENAAMLRTAVPRSISIDLQTGTPLPAIMADAAQLQQVVMNLITNAADAIGEKPGLIKLSSGVQHCDQICLADSRLEDKPEPGRFVYLEVTDNGIGMNEEIQARIFDPFFTTKFTGRGLGMSAVLGIIKGHGGALFMESLPGKGTTIRVVFPAITATAAPAHQTVADSAENSSAATGPLSGMVLVVDDEKSVLKIAATMVRLCGFSVITARDGIEAISKFRQHCDEIDVIIMDLTMPNMNGVAAMSELRRIKPGIRIILSSGFNAQELDTRINEQAPSGFIRKPYSMKEIEAELRRVSLEAA